MGVVLGRFVWACLTAHLKHTMLHFSIRVVQGHTCAAVPGWAGAAGWLLQLGRTCPDIALAGAHKTLKFVCH